MPNRKAVVKIDNIFDKFKVEINPLTIEDINELIALSMKSGFLGNLGLLKFIIERGCAYKNDADIINNKTFFTICCLTREIWILTLNSLANHTRKLMKLAQHDPTILKIHKYKFTELATPGLLWFIVRNLNYTNADKFSYDFIELHLGEAQFDNQPLGRKKTRRMIKDTFDYLSTWLLNKNAIEGQYIKELPSNIFLTSRQKFYAMIKLMTIVDWAQYYKILYHYNKALLEMTKNANLMGGLSIENVQSKLSTGVAAFIKLIRVPDFNKIQTVYALMNDVLINKKKFISAHYTKIIKHNFHEAMKETVQKFPEITTIHEEFMLELLNHMALKISKNERLVTKIELKYWEEFQEAFIKSIEYDIRKIIDDYYKSLKPDCYLLVEGESEVICYSHFIELLNNADLVIKVLDCNGKTGVERKYRELLRDDYYTGSIITVLDADAETQHENIKRINSQGALVSHHIYNQGTLEDLYNRRMVAKIFNLLYTEGTKIIFEDLNGSGQAEIIFKKVLYSRKRGRFDKNTLAREVAKRITSKKMIPKQALKITEECLHLAQKSAQLNPSSISILTNRPAPNRVLIRELEESLVQSN